MSKFCMECGAEIDDNAEICTSCGAEQKKSASAFSGVSEEAAAGGSKAPVAIIVAAVAVVIVVLVLVCNLLFGGGYKSAYEDIFKAMETGKGKYLYSAIPEFILDSDAFEDMKKKEIIEKLDDVAEGLNDGLEDQYGDDVKISIKVKDKEKLDKDELEDLEEELEDEFDDKIKVTKGYELKLKSTIKGDDKKETNTEKIKVYKINGDWVAFEFLEGMIK